MAKTKKKEIKRGLIISGGGAFGAYGAGTLAALNKDYDIVAGISTGALMSPLVALKKWGILREAYTSVTNDQIFDKKWYRPNVFTKNGKLNVLSILYVLVNRIFGRRNSLNSLATTNNLKSLIEKFVTKENYEEIKKLNKEIVVGAVNLAEKPADVHYFSTADEHVKFEDFKDWMWASANVPFVTSILEKKWYDDVDRKWYMGEWTDGGLTEVAPFDYVLQKGIKEVDIIMHRTKPIKEKEIGMSSDFLEVVERAIGAMRYDIETKDGKFDEIVARFAKENGVKIRVFWLPRKLAKNSLIFDKETMLDWYEEGFNTANDPTRIEIYE